MVEHGNIVPNMAKVYLLKSGEVRDPLGLDNFHPNSNVNGIIVHIEGGSPSNIVTMAFNPNIKNFLATHNFPLFYRGQVEHTVGNEVNPRTFAQYIGWVPNIVLALNVNKNTPMSVGVTVNEQSGIELLGAFRRKADLPDATEENHFLQDIDDCVAYVWEEDENGYYQVKFNASTQSYAWVKQSVGVNNHYNITTKKGIFTKQFNVFNMTIQKGFANPNAITQLEDEQYRLIWQDLAQLRASIIQNTTLIDDLQEQIDGLHIVVSELPEFGVPNKIYLVPNDDPKLQNTLDEFIWVNNDWERIGGISIDLSNYFNKPEVISLLDDKQDKLIAGENITIDENNVISASGSGGGNSYEPDGVTVVLNENDELEVNIKYIMDGGYL